MLIVTQDFLYICGTLLFPIARHFIRDHVINYLNIYYNAEALYVHELIS